MGRPVDALRNCSFRARWTFQTPGAGAGELLRRLSGSGQVGIASRSDRWCRWSELPAAARRIDWGRLYGSVRCLGIGQVIANS